MRARARSMLVVGLLGGGLLVALPAAGATESPPDCEDVRVLAESFQPSAAVALAEQIDARTGSASPSPVASATPVDPAAPVGTPEVSATTPVARSLCAEELGDAEDRADAAVVARDVAQRQDKEAAAIEPQDAAAAADLREQADALYALALTTDEGLADARAAIAPEGAKAADDARLAAARQLKDLGKVAEARLLASDLVLTGGAEATDVEAAGLAPVPSFQGLLHDWWEAGVSWLNALAPYIAVVAILALIAILARRPQHYELQAPTPGGGLDDVAKDWSTTVPEALEALSLDSPAVRYLGSPDAEFKLPTINGLPAGFLAVVEFWTWFRRLRRRVVTTTLEVLEGTPTANVAIRKRSGRSLKKTTLRTIRTSAAPPLPAEQVRQAFVDLASEAAAWIAFEFTAPARRVSIFGSTIPDAVVHVAGAAAANRRDDRTTIRAELVAARVADPTMLEARLNLAVLDITEPGQELFRLDEDAVARGITGLTATSAAAGAQLALTDPGVVGPGPDPGLTARRDWVRLMAIDVRARYNREIAELNLGVKPLPVADRAARAAALMDIGVRAGVIIATVGDRRRFEGIARTARDIRRYAWLLWVGHTVEWPGGLEPRLSSVVSRWPDVGTAGDPWPTAVTEAFGAPDIDALSARADYSIACIAAERNSLADMTTWLDRAIAKDAPRYLRAARKDPYFFGKGLDLPDPDADPVPDVEEDAPTPGPVAMAVVVVNAEGQSY